MFTINKSEIGNLQVIRMKHEQIKRNRYYCVLFVDVNGQMLTQIYRRQLVHSVGPSGFCSHRCSIT